MDNLSTRNLTLRYILALGLIGVLSCTAYLTMHALISTQENSAAVVNISGRQRMLSQKIALLSIQLVGGNTPDVRQIIINDITESVNLMELSNGGLLDGNPKMKLPGNPSPQIKALYFEGPVELDAQVSRFIAEVRALVSSDPAQLTPHNPHLQYILAQSQGRLLNSFESLVSTYQREAEHKITKLQNVEKAIAFITALILIMEGLFIFKPMVRGIEKERLQLANANLELRRLSSMDGLTGIANRRFFDEFLATEWRRGLRNKTPLALIMVDIDFFKAYNDTYGHLAGDSCLKEVARTLKDTLHRATDLVARFGGEEFAVILADTDLHGAAKIAEDLRYQVENLKIEHLNSHVHKYVTISLGIGVILPSRGHTPAALIAAADQALYTAKHLGRNRCQVSALYELEEGVV